MILCQPLFRSVVLALLFAGTALSGTRCEAGLFDWLTGRQQTLFRPWTTYQPGVIQQGVAVPNSCYCGPQVMRRQLVNYVPQTRFRTQWAQVPVTYYRPVTTVDPVAGCQVTYMRPCTSYQMQARRVPITTLRPVYSTVLSPARQATFAAPQVFGNGCGSCGSGSVGAVTGSPYYPSYPAGTLPSTSSPGVFQTTPPPSLAPGGVGGGFPAGTYPQGTVIQGGTVPGSGGIVPGSRTIAPPPTGAATPADRPPSLPPNAQGSNTRTPIGPQESVLRQDQPASARLRGLQPVPDPDLIDPPLINGEDRTARRYPVRPAAAWKFVPISWPSPARQTPELDTQPPAPTPQAEVPLDDTGWKSLRP